MQEIYSMKDLILIIMIISNMGLVIFKGSKVSGFCGWLALLLMTILK